MDLSALGICAATSSCIVTQVAAGLISGFLLFLVAAGLTLIFGVLGFVNFMHGSFYMLGAYFAYAAYAATGSYTAAVIAGAAGVGALGAALETSVVRRIYHADVLLQILVCYAFILIFDDLVGIVWGDEFLSMGMPSAFKRAPILLFGGVIPPFYLFLVGIALAIAIGIALLMQKTRYGKIVRALADKPGMVAALGINTQLVYASLFALGAMLAGSAGALAAPVRSMTAGMGFAILIESFIVTVIGGMGSIAGALVAALMIGLVRSFGSIGFPLFTEGLIFVIMIAVLVVRPQGLFGRQVREL
ncbi:branched-chain amino acid ABC transporter permease [Bradyrhizobium tropiciagri]|uniref:branched-chain amino acid ABC transporter permease n=1 Tax=Bradyrhizobium tropiciagri TaxID=312253 RepID=UPI00067D5ED8|nr:branched-chain amino acid ABC transporter permease [Bradyrhizobium tropiciagri]